MKDTGIVNIHGKEYSTVAKRIAEFWAKYPDHQIHTEIIESNSDCVIMRASIWKDMIKISEGHAEESRTSSQINRTSALENCETSAVGRALSFMGLGGTQIASAEEMMKVPHETISEEQQQTIEELLIAHGADRIKFKKWAKVTDLADIHVNAFDSMCQAIKRKKQ